MIRAPDQTDLTSVLRARLPELAARHGVCGAQLALRCGDQTVAVETGELEYRGGHPVTPGTAFPIGSVTKPFTATLAMMFVADGEVELDAPLGAHLPELGDLGHALTLRRLLSHTAGLPSGPELTDPSSGSARRYVADHCRPDGLVLPPGTGFSYSNMGYVVVGRLIEEITEMSWPEAVASILLRPLGIAPAFICPTGPRSPARPVATGHSVNLALGRTQPVRQSLAPAEAPAGGLAVSATDLLALARPHIPPGAPELLPPDDADEMRRPVPAAEPYGLADGWGLGLALFRGEGTDWAGHDGNADGTSCHMRVAPARGLAVALTTNTGSGIGLWQDLCEELAGLGVPLPTARPAEAAPAATSPACAGVYANGADEYVVTGTGGRFTLTVDGTGYLVSPYADGLTFALVDPSSGRRLPGGRFQRDPVTGDITGMQVSGRVARRRPYAAESR